MSKIIEYCSPENKKYYGKYQKLPLVSMSAEVIKAINDELAYQSTLEGSGRADALDHGVAGQIVSLNVYVQEANVAYKKDVMTDREKLQEKIKEKIKNRKWFENKRQQIENKDEESVHKNLQLYEYCVKEFELVKLATGHTINVIWQKDNYPLLIKNQTWIVFDIAFIATCYDDNKYWLKNIFSLKSYESLEDLKEAIIDQLSDIDQWHLNRIDRELRTI